MNVSYMSAFLMCVRALELFFFLTVSMTSFVYSDKQDLTHESHTLTHEVHA